METLNKMGVTLKKHTNGLSLLISKGILNFVAMNIPILKVCYSGKKVQTFTF
jgi:hypothetical protein